MENPEVKAKVENKIQGNIKIDIPQWNPARFFAKYLKTYGSFTSIVTGSRMSGKSNMIKFFLKSQHGGKLMDKFDMIIIFSKTIENGQYSFLKTKLMFADYQEGVLETVKKLYFSQKKQGKPFHSLVIFDDCVTGTKYKESIENHFYNSRHYHMSIIFLTQKASAASQNWKNNTTLFIILKSMSRKEKLYLSQDVIADGIEPQIPITVKEQQIVRIGTHLQTSMLDDYNAIIVTPFCKRKIKQFTAPLMKS